MTFYPLAIIYGRDWHCQFDTSRKKTLRTSWIKSVCLIFHLVVGYLPRALYSLITRNKYGIRARDQLNERKNVGMFTELAFLYVQATKNVCIKQMKWAFVICSWNAEKIWKYINFWRLLAVILLLWTICFRHNTNQEWVFSSLFLQQTMQLLHPLEVFCLVTLTRTLYIYVSLVRREKATITNPCDYISSVVWLYSFV